MLAFGCFLLFLTATCLSALSEKLEDEDVGMENPDLFEGDIVGFDPEDRNAIVRKRRLWPNGRVPYVIDPQLESAKPLILKAMQQYAEKTCIRFEPKREDDENYVKIYSGKGCNSKIGMNRGEQLLSLSRGCHFFGTVVHELCHALGFFHEHSRSDRDDYLDIHYENIQEEYKAQFIKLRPEQNHLLTPFDFDSIMLYGESVFGKGKKGELKTMTAKDGRRLQRVTKKPGLSASDAERINKLYDCKL